MPAAAKREKNPCKRTFQALRIAVNSELDVAVQGIDAAFDCLAEGGRLVIITFHSLEDRMVKQKFAQLATGCICPPEFPVCVCGRTPAARLVNKKPILLVPLSWPKTTVQPVPSCGFWKKSTPAMTNSSKE